MKKIVFVVVASLMAVVSRAAIVENLSCEYVTTPMGIDCPQPLLSWQMKSSSRDASQRAWQVMVASSKELLEADSPDLWDSGRRDGKEIMVTYGGKELQSFSRCYWKVRIWDEKGKVSRWSTTAQWAMGALEARFAVAERVAAAQDVGKSP